MKRKKRTSTHIRLPTQQVASPKHCKSSIPVAVQSSTDSDSMSTPHEDNPLNHDLMQLFVYATREEDFDTRSLYVEISKTLSRSFQEDKDVEFLCGTPPFENPSISQAVEKFVNEDQTETDLGQQLINGINDTEFIKVKDFTSQFPDTNIADYKEAYRRWVTYCYVPKFCNTLECFKPADIFGVNLLQNMFFFYKQSILDKLNSEDKKCLSKFMTKFKKFIHNSDLETVNESVSKQEKSPKKKKNSSSVAKNKGNSVLANVVELLSNPKNLQDPQAMNVGYSYKCTKLERKNIDVHVISNSSSPTIDDQILIWLAKIRDLFVLNLAQMPPLYITKVVFDPTHRCLVLVKENEVIGGICFRMFPMQDFSEIVFLAVSAVEHMKGYATYMMNNLKDYQIKHNIHNFLTCADKRASGFFKVQGFSYDITLPECSYDAFIKHYKQTILMQCHLDSKITYTKIPDINFKQYLVVKSLIKMNQAATNKKTH